MKSGKLASPTDWLFAGMLMAAAVVLGIVLAAAPAGKTVVFRQGGRIVSEYPLSEDRIVEMKGEYTNVFTISEGAVRVTHTDCPNHQCAAAGQISAAGASIVCVPNQVSASIEGGEEPLDALAG